MEESRYDEYELSKIQGILRYEWEILCDTSQILDDIRNKRLGNIPKGMISAVVESFATHARNLCEFLYLPTSLLTTRPQSNCTRNAVS